MHSPPPTGRAFLTLLTTLLPVVFNSAAMGQTTPCNVTAHHTVSTNTMVNISTWYPSGNSATGKVIEIQAGGALIIDKDFSFTSCTFRCGDQAHIIVQNSWTLTALGCQFFTCSDVLWAGITLQDGASIVLLTSRIRDAFQAINFSYYTGASNVLRNNAFENNFYNLYCNAATVGFTSCWSNKFLANGNDQGRSPIGYSFWCSPEKSIHVKLRYKRWPAQCLSGYVLRNLCCGLFELNRRQF